MLDVYQRLKHVRWARIFSKMAQVWLLAHPGVSSQLMRVFVCVKVEDVWWLEADMRLQCYNGQWSGVAFVSAAMLLVYTLGLPAGIAGWLWSRRRSLTDETTRQELGFLYEDYGTGPGQYLWEVEELLRKLFLTSFVLFLDAGSPFQICFALVVSAYAHVAHSLWRPYVDRAAYLLQHLSLAVTTSVFAFGLLFKVDGLGETSAGVVNALGVVLVLLCAAVLACSAVLVVLRLAQQARKYNSVGLRDTRRHLGPKSETAGQLDRAEGIELPLQTNPMLGTKPEHTADSPRRFSAHPTQRASSSARNATLGQPRTHRSTMATVRESRSSHQHR